MSQTNQANQEDLTSGSPSPFLSQTKTTAQNAYQSLQYLIDQLEKLEMHCNSQNASMQEKNLRRWSRNARSPLLHLAKRLRRYSDSLELKYTATGFEAQRRKFASLGGLEGMKNHPRVLKELAGKGKGVFDNE